MDERRICLNPGLFSTVLCLMVTVAPGVALAQEPAHSLQDLQSRVHIGDTIRIIDPRGDKAQGELESISDSLLRVRVNGAAREFREPGIREVYRRFRDPIKNGTLKGALIGAAGGVVAGLVISTGEACESSSCVMGGTIIAGGIGAGIGTASGALVDSLKHSYATVFVQPKVTDRRFVVSPLLSLNTKGVKFTLRW